ncbi:MAG TPA: peptidylprolyl isomerase [Vicinamibacterales bacterium]|jgi:peptidyl-prolyl cis-trans isomerase A (cyclophilin A)|nr:peptidylprolyl isomerase [Vicinamibacterales bacterium]
MKKSMFAAVAMLAAAAAFAGQGGTASLKNPASLTEQAPATYKASFDTSVGKFVITVHRAWAPNGADRFYNLVKNGFYDETRFFRVVPDFMVQFGISGDPAVAAPWQNASIKDDPSTGHSNTKGFVSFATRGPNTRTTQIFINYANNAGLDKQGFTPFGEVTTGMDVVEKITSQYAQKPDQGQIQSQGNTYLKAQFPKLDYVKKATIEK